MEASSASAPLSPHIEPEPRGWQPRALWVAVRLWVGSVSFFFIAFVFAYFYLRSLDTNNGWKIGAVNPSIGLGLAGIVLQFIEYTQLAFGAASGGYASVFFGWTATYAIFAVGCVYWMETQVASVWRARREGLKRPVREGVPADDLTLMRAGLDACSFFWAYYAAVGVVAFIILYLV